MKEDRLYFNGNLFRIEDISKTNAVLNTLSLEESIAISEVDSKLTSIGCLSVEEVEKILGDKLYNKLMSIAFYDLNIMKNSYGSFGYVTKPGVFAKYGSNAVIDDAFNNAKALISALAYGMQRSSHERGNIRMLDKLMAKLIRGEWLKPVPAIGEDYKILEARGVVQIRPQNNWKGPAYSMKLLKIEVGQIALKVSSGSDVTEHSLENFPESPVSQYIEPETNRQNFRVGPTPRSEVEILRALGAIRR